MNTFTFTFYMEGQSESNYNNSPNNADVRLHTVYTPLAGAAAENFNAIAIIPIFRKLEPSVPTPSMRFFNGADASGWNNRGQVEPRQLNNGWDRFYWGSPE